LGRLLAALLVSRMADTVRAGATRVPERRGATCMPPDLQIFL
jgi:hypothetical protein